MTERLLEGVASSATAGEFFDVFVSFNEVNETKEEVKQRNGGVSRGDRGDGEGGRELCREGGGGHDDDGGDKDDSAAALRLSLVRRLVGLLLRWPDRVAVTGVAGAEGETALFVGFVRLLSSVIAADPGLHRVADR